MLQRAKGFVPAASADMLTDGSERTEATASFDGVGLSIEFDNDADPTATVITLSGKDHTDLLSQMTGAFNSLDMIVNSATISTEQDGKVLDVFRVTENEEKVTTQAPDLITSPPSLLLISSQNAKTRMRFRCRNFWLVNQRRTDTFYASHTCLGYSQDNSYCDICMTFSTSSLSATSLWSSP